MPLVAFGRPKFEGTAESVSATATDGDMADPAYISRWMILPCALALTVGSRVARASEIVEANSLRVSQVEPAVALPVQGSSGPIVEYGPMTAMADEAARTVAGAPSAPLEDGSTERRPLGQPSSALLDAERQRPLARAAAEEGASSSGGVGLTDGAGRTLGALGAVLGLIVLARWVIRRVSQRTGGLLGQLGAGGRAPSGVLEVLGRFPVGRGQSLVLLRLDRRVLLLSQSSQGFTTLTEIDDPQDVASLVVKTADDESASLAARFRSILSGFERDPSLGVEVEEVGGPTTLRLARRRREDVVEVRSEAAGRDAAASIRRRLAQLRGEEAA